MASKKSNAEMKEKRQGSTRGEEMKKRSGGGCETGMQNGAGEATRE